MNVSAFLRHYGFFAVFFGVMLEDFGLPLPGETLLIAGAVLAGEGKMSVFIVLPLGWLGAVIGDNIGFAIGHYGGRRLIKRYGSKVGITDKRLNHVERVFHRWGPGLVIVARFITIVRNLNGIVAGMAGMRWKKFLLYNAIGAALWVCVWGVGSYFLGKTISFKDLAHYVEDPWIAVPFACVTAAIFGFLIWREWRQTAKDAGADKEG